MEQITVSPYRMRIQEIALVSLIKRGECEYPIYRYGRRIYKVKCENPWVRTDGKRVPGLR